MALTLLLPSPWFVIGWIANSLSTVSNDHHEERRGPEGEVESEKDEDCRSKGAACFPGWLTITELLYGLLGSVTDRG